jgi:hypothetical protein
VIIYLMLNYFEKKFFPYDALGKLEGYGKQ